MKYCIVKVGFTETVVSEASVEPRIGKYFSSKLEYLETKY